MPILASLHASADLHIRRFLARSAPIIPDNPMSLWITADPKVLTNWCCDSGCTKWGVGLISTSYCYIWLCCYCILIKLPLTLSQQNQTKRESRASFGWCTLDMSSISSIAHHRRQFWVYFEEPWRDKYFRNSKYTFFVNHLLCPYKILIHDYDLHLSLPTESITWYFSTSAGFNSFDYKFICL